MIFLFANPSTIFERFYNAFINKDLYLLYLKGAGSTLVIALGACLIGIIIGLLVTLVKIAPKNNLVMKILDKICGLYTTIIRGTPVVVQLMIMYFVILVGMATIGDGILVAIVTFGINSGAYVSEILRGGLLGVDKGQMEASRSLGLGWVQSMGSVVIPQGLKSSVPSLFNEFIQLVKETSVAGAIGMLELTKVQKIVTSQTMDMFTPLIIIAVIYLIMVLGLQQVQKVLERRFGKSDLR